MISRFGAGMLVVALSALPVAAEPASVTNTVSTYANAAIARGNAIGVGVVVLMPGENPQIFTFGDAIAPADGKPGKRFTSHGLFELASVTKVFTTNLLAQVAGRQGLDRQLGTYDKVLGPLQPLSATATLLDLATFTAGVPDYAPLCQDGEDPATTGCLPDVRPPVSDYGAADYAAFFRSYVPQNYQVNPAVPVSTLPAPYVYSDFALGLVGLLLANNPDEPLNDHALNRWEHKIRNNILTPLGMSDTMLTAPNPQKRIGGYQQALAIPVVKNGGIGAVQIASSGANYSADAPPAVTITGAGTGAAAHAVVVNGSVQSVVVDAPGAGYVAPARFTISGSTPSAPAELAAIVKNGKVTAVEVVVPGIGYSGTPTVTISGGRASGPGRDALLSATVVNGHIAYVKVRDGGSGYAQPPAVIVAPGTPVYSVVPIWGAAGSLLSSLKDMSRFAAAALGRLAIGRTIIPQKIRDAFALAQKPFVCEGTSPSKHGCPADTTMSGLAWDVQLRDAAAGVPRVIVKNGSLSGFSTQVMLIPESDLGVVVFGNSRQIARNKAKLPTAVSEVVARNIIYSLYFQCVKGKGCN